MRRRTGLLALGLAGLLALLSLGLAVVLSPPVALRRLPAPPGTVPPDLVYLLDRLGDDGMPTMRLLAVRADTGTVVGLPLALPWPEMFTTRLAFSADGAWLFVGRARQQGQWGLATVEVFDARRLRPWGDLYSARVEARGGPEDGPAVTTVPVPSPDGQVLAVLQEERLVGRLGGPWRRASVGLIDLPSRTVLAQVPLAEVEAEGSGLHGRFTADGRRLVLCQERLVGRRLAGVDLVTVDLPARQVVARRTLETTPPAGCIHWWVAPTGQAVYFLDRQAETSGLAVRAAPDWSPAGFIPLPGDAISPNRAPLFTLLAPDGRSLFVIAERDQRWSLLKVDLPARQVVARQSLIVPDEERPAYLLFDRLLAFLAPVAEAKPIPLPLQAVLSPDGRRLYVPAVRVTAPFRDPWGNPREARSDGLWVLAAGDLRPLARLLPGRALWGWGSVLALSSTGDRLYVLDPAGGALTVVDVGSGAELATWPGLVTHLAQIERVVPAAPEMLSAGS